MSSISDAHEMLHRPQMQPVAGAMGEPEVADEAPGIKVGDVLRILKQRKTAVFVTFVVVYMLIIGATVVVWKWFPAFPAEAYLELRPPQEDAFASGDRLVDPRQMEMLIQTEARKIKQYQVLQGVLSLDEIKATAFYRWYDSFDECLDDLESILQVAPIPDTQLITVRLSCQNRDDAVLIVKTVVDRYVESYKVESSDKGRQAWDDLKSTRAALEKDLQEKQRQLAIFRMQTNVGELESESEMLARSITDLTYLVNTYDARAADLQGQLDIVQGVDPTTLPITPEDRVIVESDPLLRMYRQQVENMDIQINTNLQHLVGPNHRSIKMMRSNRDGYYRMETARREELLDDLRERRVNSLREEMARVRSVQASVQDQLAELESKQQELDRARVGYDTKVKEEDRVLKSLERIDAASLELQHLAETTPQTPRLHVVQWPQRAVRPSRPNVKMWLGGGFVFAFVAGIGLAFLREILDTAIRTPIDVARHGRLSVLGCIPELDDVETDVDQIEMIIRREPHSLVAELFRQMRANLVFSGPSETQRSLLITSPGPGDGKTAVAINLAITLAQANERVLLVDCNFRRPALRSAFADTKADGLSNFLIGQVKLEDLATKTDIPNLDILTSGPMPPTPAELLGSGYMNQLLEQAQGKYDRLIFDGPPVLLISDALVIATQVGGVLMVARAVETSKGFLKRACEQLDKINAHLIGAILNGVQARPGGYYRKQYREFYEYVSDETIPPELPDVPVAERSSDEDDTFS